MHDDLGDAARVERGAQRLAHPHQPGVPVGEPLGTTARLLQLAAREVSAEAYARDVERDAHDADDRAGGVADAGRC